MLLAQLHFCRPRSSPPSRKQLFGRKVQKTVRSLQAIGNYLAALGSAGSACHADAQGCLGSTAEKLPAPRARANVCLSRLRALITLDKGQCLPKNNVGLKFSKSLCNSL